MKIGLIDCDDSYTLNIADYLRQCGAEVEVINHEVTSIDSLENKKFQALVLSPGPKKPSEVPILFEIIEHFETKIPLLGICLGHQAIGMYYGLEITRSSHPVHGSPVEIIISDDPIFKSIQRPFFAMRYNSLTLNPAKNGGLKVICQDNDGEIMGLKHPILPIYSFQFHPESIGTPQGILIFKNWIELVQSRLERN